MVDFFLHRFSVVHYVPIYCWLVEAIKLVYPVFNCYHQTLHANSYVSRSSYNPLLQEFVAQYREQFHTLVTKGQEMDETYGKLLVIAIM